MASSFTGPGMRSGAARGDPDLASDLPEMETFEVELVKDQQGLGITIAGYVCEKEEISGIFVKSIAKGSAADMCGQIRVNDQIIEVDGRPLHGYTNHDAVEVLRSTGKSVKLRLARYLRGAKYQQLQLAIASGELSYPTLPTVQAQVHESTDAANKEVDVNDINLFVDNDFEIALSPRIEATIQAKWSKVMGPEYEIVIAQISKFREGGGLGISLEGTVDVEDGKEVRPHHYIRSILPDGPVGVNGKLQSGDELLEVNGEKLLGMNHHGVVATLKELPMHVRMVCARRLLPSERETHPSLSQANYSHPYHMEYDLSTVPDFIGRGMLSGPFGGSLTSLTTTSERLVKAKSDGSLAIGTSAASSPPMEAALSKLKSRSLEPLTGLAMWSSEPQIIELMKGDRGLGFSILDYQDPMNPNETVIVIRSLVPGGVAQQDGRLIPGDRLLFVNDINLENASLDAAVQALKGAPKGVVRIGVAKPLPLPESGQSGQMSLDNSPTLPDFKSSFELPPRLGLHLDLEQMGLMYVFNLIVGTGALAMPASIAEAGWLLSLIVLIILAIMSFVTVTFVTESMAAANALVHSRTVRHLKKVMKTEDENEDSSQQLVERFLTDEVISNSLENEKVPLLLSNSMDTISETSAEYFNITERIEMGKMAMLFFNRIGVNIFYLFICVYLYGDLTIYAAAVSKSLRDVTCTHVPSDAYCNATLNDSVPCWDYTGITRGNSYRIFLAVFLVLLGPFTFFNVQKTKYLQIFTTIMRWLAFCTMIIFAATALIKGNGRGHPKAANIGGIPNLFGVCVYSFMCHHSLPSLITPIQNKSHLLRLFTVDYLLILLFYCLLSFTGIFTFEHLQDIYTLNFEPQKCNDTHSGDSIIADNLFVIRYFLALFPVFTLSTNFPIIAITLRNNLKSVFLKDNKKYSFFMRNLLFPSLAVIPPVAIAFATEDLTILVGITGSYAGAVIQYVVPALLVYYARRDVLATLGLGIKNKHASPFRHSAWILFVLIWAAMCIIFVTVNHIIKKQ